MEVSEVVVKHPHFCLVTAELTVGLSNLLESSCVVERVGFTDYSGRKS